MTEFITLSNVTLSSDKPITESVARAFRDNPIAMSEGAEGAPRFRPQPTGGLTPATLLLSNNTAGVQMTNNDSTMQLWKETYVPHDGTYTVTVDYSISNGYGANAQFYVDGVAQGSKFSTSGTGGTWTATLTVKSGQRIQVYGNGGSAGGSSNAFVANLKIFASTAFQFIAVR